MNDHQGSDSASRCCDGHQVESEVRVGSQHASWGPQACSLALGKQVSWRSRDQAGTVSCRAPEPSPRPPTSLGPGLESSEPLPHPYICDLIAEAICLGCSLWNLVNTFRWPEETEGHLGWVPGSLSDDSWAGCGDLALRELPAELCLLLVRMGTLEGDSCALGSCPFLSGQTVTFVWWRFTGISLLDHHWTSRTQDLTQRNLQQLTIPPPFPFALQRALLSFQ